MKKENHCLTIPKLNSVYHIIDTDLFSILYPKKNQMQNSQIRIDTQKILATFVVRKK